jgi:hypothetical protein
MPTFRITSAPPSIVGTPAIVKSAQSPRPGSAWRSRSPPRTRRPPGLFGRSLPRDPEDCKFLPRGRIQAGAGTSAMSPLFNCFLIGIIEDSILIFSATTTGFPKNFTASELPSGSPRHAGAPAPVRRQFDLQDHQHVARLPLAEFRPIYDLAYDKGLRSCATFRRNAVTG